MNESTTIKDPQTFGKGSTFENTRADIRQESLNGISFSLFDQKGIRCPRPVKEGTYNCEICQKLKLVCPSASTYKQQDSTFIRGETSNFSKNNYSHGTFMNGEKGSFSRPIRPSTV